ncbi:hypothetical protein DTO166G4_1639 [Paecilomyces variotii]|nr:hypothetical protein DTO166G4_1639 [Paecilomyces variotii]KAJ9248584.1 hypothetical protein DTO195F2_8804 [Paecilomyces variotii]KAJ9372411.1 hypothetical protein DTO282E5_2998 [Paecilomyces variotii]
MLPKNSPTIAEKVELSVFQRRQTASGATRRPAAPPSIAKLALRDNSRPARQALRALRIANMASNREERLQMRQRGAGTRQIKAVDFGFSFGLPGPEPAEPPRQSPRASTNLPVPRVSPRRSATPNKQPTPPSQPPEATPSSGSRSSQRDHPRSSSSRNHLPERPSTFDLPSDDVPEQGRSAKRRRISPLSENAKTTSNAKQTERVDPQPGTVSSGDDVQSDTAANPGLAEESPTTGRTNSRRPRDTTFAERGTEQQVEPVSQAANGTNGVDKDHGDEAQPANAADPSITNSKSKRKKRASTAENRKSGPTVESATDINNAERIEEPVEAAQPSRSSRRSLQKTVEPREASSPQETRKRGRTAAKATSNARKDTGKETSPAEENSRQPKRSRKSLGKQREIPVDDERVEERQQAEPEEVEEQEKNQTSRQKRTKKGKQRKSIGRPPTRNRPSTESVPEEPEASPSRQQQDIDEEEQVDQPQAESSTRRESSATKKAPKKAKARKEKATRTEEDEEDAEPTPREKKTRGETVPVTVHRLANIEALSAVPDSSESADEAEESTVKDLSGRSGVNPADVLSQICRETLDKTLTTLKNGIANESNQARRAEWTRKRKAVEAFGAELEGRLFEMSEMLDSNFSLSAQLKKAKRKMADMRSRLLHIRRQREEVALRMDEVRRKHTEDENAKMARNAINNSLHSLELAIDRNKARNDRPSDDDEPTTAGLEFMLRTVAENVSSAAPGSQGGLLNQIKSFNAQLERAAKKLERMI